MFRILTRVWGLCWLRRWCGSDSGKSLSSEATLSRARLGRLLEKGRWPRETGGRVGGGWPTLAGGLTCVVCLFSFSVVGKPVVLRVLRRRMVWGGPCSSLSLFSVCLFSSSLFLSSSCLCCILHHHNRRVTSTHATPTTSTAVARIAITAYRW